MSRIVKNVLNEGSLDDEKSPFILSKDSLTVIQRSSVVFISYLFHSALLQSKEENRKTANAQDILTALTNSGFGAYVPVLQEELEKFNLKAALKKQAKLSAGEKADDDDEDLDLEDEDADQAKKKLKANDGSTVDPLGTNSSKPDMTEDDIVEEEPVDEEPEDEDEEEGEKLKPSQILALDHRELEGEHGNEGEGSTDDVVEIDEDEL